MHVTFGEEGSWVSVVVVVFFLRTSMGLFLDLPLLLLPTLLLRNLINGGGNFSPRPGLEMGFVGTFIVRCEMSENEGGDITVSDMMRGNEKEGGGRFCFLVCYFLFYLPFIRTDG